MIRVKKCVLGRPIAKELVPIKGLDTIDVGFGPGQLRPNGSRQPESERMVFRRIISDINGMSGQLAS